MPPAGFGRATGVNIKCNADLKLCPYITLLNKCSKLSFDIHLTLQLIMFEKVYCGSGHVINYFEHSK